MHALRVSGMIALLAEEARADDCFAVARAGDAVVLAATWSGHAEAWWVGPEGVRTAYAWPERDATNPGVACGRAGCLVTATLPSRGDRPATLGWLVVPGGAARGPLFFGPGTRATPVATRRGFRVVVEEPPQDLPALRTARLVSVDGDGRVGIAVPLPVDDALGGSVRPDPDGGGASWITRRGARWGARLGEAPAEMEPAAVPHLPQVFADPLRVTEGDGAREALRSEVVVRGEGGAVAFVGRGTEPGPDGADAAGVAHAGIVGEGGVISWSAPVVALGAARAAWVGDAALSRLFQPDRDGRGPGLVVPVETESVFGRGQAELSLVGGLAGDAVVAAPPDEILRAWATTPRDLPAGPGLFLHLREHATGPDTRTTATGAAIFGGAAFVAPTGPCGAVERVVVAFDGTLVAEFARGVAELEITRRGTEGGPGRDGERRLEGQWRGACAPADAAGSAWLRWQLEAEPVVEVRTELGPTHGGMGL